MQGATFGLISVCALVLTVGVLPDKKTLLVITPLRPDVQTLRHPRFSSRYNVIFHYNPKYTVEKFVTSGVVPADKPGDLRGYVREIVNYYNPDDIDGVFSSCDYTGNIVSAIVAQEFGLPGPDPRSLLICQNKYLSRCAQKELVPEATPQFQLMQDNELVLNFPCFVKPVKGSFSMGARRVDDHHALQDALDTAIPPWQFCAPLDVMVQRYCGSKVRSNALLAEELLEGKAVTVEGYTLRGMTRIYGITDSIMYPNTISFQRFEYPTSLPKSVQERMSEIARKFIAGVGFDNSLFNIEMIYNPHNDSIHIIEVNPRWASQFADLHERVDGVNGYQILIDVALGNEPTICSGAGCDNIAASCALRVFEDKYVRSVPSQRQISHLHAQYPDTVFQILVKVGKPLSASLQDGKSFVYATINLGAANLTALLARLEECKKYLRFSLEPIDTLLAQQ